MIDFLKSVMTPDLLFGIFNVVKFVLTKFTKDPISKLEFNIDKGDFHCDFHLSR